MTLSDMTTSSPALPDTTVTELTAEDPRSLLAGAVKSATPVLTGITDDQHRLPTPCGTMMVADLAEHVVMAMRRVACAGRGLPPEQWPVDAADVAPGGWADAFVAAAHDVQDVWGDDALLGRPTVLPWGTFDGSQVLGVYTNEMVVHAWDLAQATGQDPEWDDAVLEASLAVMHEQLPHPVRSAFWAELAGGLPEGVEFDPPFADAVAVADDAPLIDRLVAWNGRDPGQSNV